MNSNLEYQLTADDQLCFIHIFKSAGTTFTSILGQQFDIDQICPKLKHLPEINLQNAQGKIAPEYLMKYCLLRKHFSYHSIDHLIRKPLCLAILCNPIDRALFLYSFLKRAKEKGESEYNEHVKGLRFEAATSHSNCFAAATSIEI